MNETTWKLQNTNNKKKLMIEQKKKVGFYTVFPLYCKRTVISYSQKIMICYVVIMICTTLYTCSFILPPPAAAWCCSCCSPGPAAGCASVGSQPQCESHSAPCSAAPPHTHLCLPKTSTISTLSNSCTTHNWLELKTCVSAFISQWIS